MGPEITHESRPKKDPLNQLFTQSKARDLNSTKITSLEPGHIDWNQSREGKPQEAVLIRYIGCESDLPEVPIYTIKEGDTSNENVELIVSDLSSYGFSKKELVGVIWNGNELGIYGQGGSGYSPEYKFYKLKKGVIEEI